VDKSRDGGRKLSRLIVGEYVENMILFNWHNIM